MSTAAVEFSMTSFDYFRKRDCRTWRLFLRTLCLLFICKWNCGIKWYDWCYEVRDILVSIFLSVLAAIAFYVVVDAIPIYKGKDFKLKSIGDDLTELNSILKDILSKFNHEESYHKIGESDNRELTLKSKRYLCNASTEAIRKFNSIQRYFDILPPTEIETLNKIYVNDGFQRVYHGCYNDILSTTKQNEICQSLNTVINQIAALERNVASYQD